MTRSSKFLVAFLVSMLVVGTGTAYAYWTAGATGNAAASADAVNAGSAPTGSATGTSITINWAASTTAAAHAVQGYVVTRYNAASGGTSTPATNGCSGTIAALNCTETGLANGTWYYTVTPKLQNWLGAESTRSAGITVDTVAPVLSSINRAGANPAIAGPLTWTVTFTEPVNGVTNTNFSLVTSGLTGTAPSITSTTATGGAPSATWTVSVSTTGTTGTNSGSIGLNLANNTNIKDVANNALSTLSFTGQAYTYDTTAPALSTLQMFDDDHDGKVDKVVATFNDTLGACTAPCTTGWTLTSPPGGATLAGVTVSGSQATLNLNEGTVSTAVGSFTVALQNTSGIVDSAGNHSSFTAIAPTDKAEPVAVSAAFTNGNGQALLDDTFALTFSERLSVSTVCSSWSNDASDQLAEGGNGGSQSQIRITQSGTNDILSMPGGGSSCGGTVNFGSAPLGADYATSTVNFAGNNTSRSQITWNATTLVLTLVLGGGTGQNTGVTAGVPTYTPSASITDIAGNAAETFSGTYSSGRF